jgi:hypothetical protein
MSGFRFSIATLLLAVAVIGAGLAALKANSPTLAGLLTLAMLGVNLSAVVGVVFSEGQSRYFWLGVALFGSAYFGVVFTPLAPAAKAEIEAPLKAFRDQFWSSVLPPNTKPQSPGVAWRADRTTNQRIAAPLWDYAFGTTLHCVANSLFALFGGIVGKQLYTDTAKRKIARPANTNL